MKIAKNKTIATMIALFLMLTIAIPLAAMPIANAHDPPLTDIPTYAYITVQPNPVGVGQQVFVVFWLNLVPPTATGIAGDRWRNLKVEVTKPDGSKESLGTFTSDPIGGSYTKYTPDVVGTYTFEFSYPNQGPISRLGPLGIPGSNSEYINDTFLGNSAKTTLTVQQEPITVMPTYPLPSEYWTRPIEGQNTAWGSLGSNWLGGAHLRGWPSLWQKDGIAPNSPHIMWTRPIEFGGIVGGTTEIPNVGYYSGGSYEGRFSDAVIMQGRLYFTQPLGHAPGGGGYISLDLRTGEEIWYRGDLGVNTTAAPSKGQVFEYESLNQHGVVGGVLWQVVDTKWNAYDPFTGLWMYSLTGVPSGFEVYTDKGEIVRYVLNYSRRWMALWNNTADHQGLQGGIGDDTSAYQWRPNGKTVDMSKAYSWNVSIPDLPGNSAPEIVKIIPGDLIFGMSSNVGLENAWRTTPDPYTLWAISDKPATRGQLLWLKNYAAPAGNLTRMLAAQPLDIVNRVFTMMDYETGVRYGYSLDTGSLLWGPVGTPYQEPGARAYQYYSGREGFPAYGNLYLGGFGGEIFGYSMKNGTLLWKYNNTYSGLEGPWGNHPTAIFAIADGKVFGFTNEHSPNYPLYKDQRIWVVDAFTGEEVWTLTSIAGTSGGSRAPTSIVADGFVVFYNFYDNQIYTIGKGPSATTVEAPMTSVTRGSRLVIRGSVTDTAAGTKQDEQVARFPHGVPAVSDESMRTWMEYVYMQKSLPTNATGVTVTIDVIDSNGNYRNIGSAITDINGFYSLQWTPDISGMYTVIASFSGSESYWPSSAQTAFAVDEAAPTPTAQAPLALPPFEMYTVGTGIAIIIAVAIVGLMILRKRP